MKFEVVFLPVIFGGIIGIFIGLFLKTYLKISEIFEEKGVKNSCFILSIKLVVKLWVNIKEVLKHSSLKQYLLPYVEQYIKEQKLLEEDIKTLNLEVEKIIKKFEDEEQIKILQTEKNVSIFFVKEEIKEKGNSSLLPNIDRLKGVETTWHCKLPA